MKFPKHLARLQPNGYTCGPSALRHALLCYGVRRSVRWLAAACEADTDGTNEYSIHAAAKMCGYNVSHSRFHSSALTQETIRWHIRQCHPVLLCVDTATDGPWQHWICVVGAATSYVTICDSARPGPVVRRHTWRQLMQRLAVWENGRSNRYDVYPVLPG